MPYVLIAALLDGVLLVVGIAWWLFIGPARALRRLVGPADPDKPAFSVVPSLLLPTLSNTYLLARYSIQGDDTWEIIGEVPANARYFSITLYGPRGRSHDYSQGQRIALNDEQLVYDDPATRTFRVVISPRNRGYANWLDCSQCDGGLVMIRENGVPRAQAVVPRIVVHRAGLGTA